MLDGVQILTRERGNVEGKWSVQDMPMSGGRYTQHRSAGGMRLGRTRCGAHWRHRANTFEPSVCGGDAALCHMSNYVDHLFFIRRVLFAEV